MAIVTDMTVILGDNAVKIGDGNSTQTFDFGTGGRRVDKRAILMFMVRGLNHATYYEPTKDDDHKVPIYINNHRVGWIMPERWDESEVGDTLAPKLRNAARKFWRTQIVEFSSNRLNNGDNTLRIEAGGFPESSGDNNYDDFWIRDIVCHFKQSA